MAFFSYYARKISGTMWQNFTKFSQNITGTNILNSTERIVNIGKQIRNLGDFMSKSWQNAYFFYIQDTTKAKQIFKGDITNLPDIKKSFYENHEPFFRFCVRKIPLIYQNLAAILDLWWPYWIFGFKIVKKKVYGERLKHSAKLFFVTPI